MNKIDIEQFAAIAYQQPLTDVFACIASETIGSFRKWSFMEGGPILFCFDDDCIVWRQPIGESHVEMMQLTLEEWTDIVAHEYPEEDFPDTEHGLIRIFHNVYYPKNLDHLPPSITGITQFQIGETESTGALFLEFSTGGSFGVDATEYGGLVWFLDGQCTVFRRTCMDVFSMKERVLPKFL